MVKFGKKIMFVVIKKQACEIVVNVVCEVGMFFVIDCWFGGMMINFFMICCLIKKMNNIDCMFQDGILDNVIKKECFILICECNKLECVFGGIVNLNCLFFVVFIVDIYYEYIVVVELYKLGLKIFGMVDINFDFFQVDYVIFVNDDVFKLIVIIINYMVECICQGLKDREFVKLEKEVIVKG